MPRFPNINYQIYHRQLNMLINSISFIIIVDVHSVNSARNRKEKFAVKNGKFQDIKARSTISSCLSIFLREAKYIRPCLVTT